MIIIVGHAVGQTPTTVLFGIRRLLGGVPGLFKIVDSHAVPFLTKGGAVVVFCSTGVVLRLAEAMSRSR